MSALCERCGGVPYEWVWSKYGAISIAACGYCPKPEEQPPEPIHAVLGAVLYDSRGELGHWARARETLLAFSFGAFEDAIVAWMSVVADDEAPSLEAVMRHMGPQRCTPLFRWHLHAWLRDAARADDFDRALVDVVRRQPTRRAA